MPIHLPTRGTTRNRRIASPIAGLLSTALLGLTLACGGGGGGGGNAPVFMLAHVANRAVHAFAEGPDGTTYVGGSFDRVGPLRGHGVPVDSSEGRPASFPVVNGPVYAAVPDGAGGMVLRRGLFAGGQ